MIDFANFHKKYNSLFIQSDRNVIRILPHCSCDHVGDSKIKEYSTNYASRLRTTLDSYDFLLMTRCATFNDDVVLIFAR